MERTSRKVLREPDPSQTLRGLYDISRFYCQAALRHVTILRAPVIAMIDYEAVAALAALDGTVPALADRKIRDAVTHPEDAARGRGEDVDASTLRAERGNAEISAFVIIVRPRAALEVANRRRGIMIHIALHFASPANFTIDREPQLYRLRDRT